MWITGKTRLQKKKQEHTYQTGGSNHVSSPQHSHRPQLCWQGYKVHCPKCCWMACICPMTCASNQTLQGQSQLRQLNFPHPRGAAPYISSLPTQRGCSFFPPKALMEQGEPLACSQPVPYQAASLLPSYHSSSSSSTETTTNPPSLPLNLLSAVLIQIQVNSIC